MSGNRHVEVHYINTGMCRNYELLQSLKSSLAQGNSAHLNGTANSFSSSVSHAYLERKQVAKLLIDVEPSLGNAYWSVMQTNSYKYGFSGSTGNYYNFSQLYELNDYETRLDGGRRLWENPVPASNLELPQLVTGGPQEAEESATPSTVECIRANNSTSPQQYVWQDNIDPDSMTYEELLDLGETVGTQSRGLSQERISSLPVTKYKSSFFSRKKKQSERCVICQMEYRRGDRQMTLPCKHVYHSGCVSRWLAINKACPVCFTEVPNEKLGR